MTKAQLLQVAIERGRYIDHVEGYGTASAEEPALFDVKSSDSAPR